MEKRITTKASTEGRRCPQAESIAVEGRRCPQVVDARRVGLHPRRGVGVPQ